MMLVWRCATRNATSHPHDARNGVPWPCLACPAPSLALHGLLTCGNGSTACFRTTSAKYQREEKAVLATKKPAPMLRLQDLRLSTRVPSRFACLAFSFVRHAAYVCRALPCVVALVLRARVRVVALVLRVRVRVCARVCIIACSLSCCTVPAPLGCPSFLPPPHSGENSDTTCWRMRIRQVRCLMAALNDMVTRIMRIVRIMQSGARRTKCRIEGQNAAGYVIGSPGV